MDELFNNLSIKTDVCNLCKIKYDKILETKFCTDCSRILTYHYPNCDCIYCNKFQLIN